ncbi:MAG: hypothetical protein ACT4QF_09790 [Sporichthyaceae bacterium]
MPFGQFGALVQVVRVLEKAHEDVLGGQLGERTGRHGTGGNFGDRHPNAGDEGGNVGSVVHGQVPATGPKVEVPKVARPEVADLASERISVAEALDHG